MMCYMQKEKEQIFGLYRLSSISSIKSSTAGGKLLVCNKKPHFIKGRFGGNVNIIAKGDSSSQNIVTWLINKKKPSHNDLA